MTIKLHATVRRRFEVHPLGYDRGMSPWIARAYINGVPQYHRTATAESHPEAMLAAYKLIADLDFDLMAEVHESSANRRAERCGGCRDLGPHRNVPDCEFYTPEAP